MIYVTDNDTMWDIRAYWIQAQFQFHCWAPGSNYLTPAAYLTVLRRQESSGRNHFSDTYKNTWLQRNCVIIPQYRLEVFLVVCHDDNPYCNNYCYEMIVNQSCFVCLIKVYYSDLSRDVCVTQRQSTYVFILN